jgi:hypothetical protein
VTVAGADAALQPLAFVTVTLYVPEVVTLIDCVVAPFDQRYDAALDAVSVTEPPAQNVVGPPAVIVGVAGIALTVTVVAAEVALQPLAFVTVTLNEPEVVTLIDCVVAPFDQRYPAALGAVKVTEPPSQNVVGPPAVITGIDGFAFTVTVIGADVALQPLAFVTVTLYEPDVVTSIDCVVAPFDQRYDVALGAVSVTEPPSQNEVAPEGEMTGVAGLAFTVTLVEADVALQPLAVVTVTLNEPDAVTLIDCVVAPFDQRYDAPLFAVRVTALPSQNVVAPKGVIDADGVSMA